MQTKNPNPNSNQNPIHWKSTLMTCPSYLQEYPAKISGVVYNEEFPCVLATVKRDKDNLEATIMFSHYATCCYDEDGPEDPKVPESIQKLCDDFQTNNPRDLLGVEVDGVYFGNYLVGIRRR